MIEIYNHQTAISLTNDELQTLQNLAEKAHPLALENPANEGGVLAGLDVVEISIVDDATIAQVHLDFMNIEGATDVITFEHGEIVISAETAASYAQDYNHSTFKEMTLYMIHGLLHLAGHEDAEPKERQVMESIQFSILSNILS